MQVLHGPLWRLEKVEMHILATVTELSTAELQGKVLHDKPRYPSSLTQVHTDIQLTYEHIHGL